MTDESLRTSMLREAERLISGDRNNTYGEPHQDFQRTADMLSAMGFRFDDPRGQRPVRAHDVAMVLAVVKLSRLAWAPGKRDSWVDLAGYAACGYEAYELTSGTDAASEATEPAVRYAVSDGGAYYRQRAGEKLEYWSPRFQSWGLWGLHDTLDERAAEDDGWPPLTECTEGDLSSEEA